MSFTETISRTCASSAEEASATGEDFIVELLRLSGIDVCCVVHDTRIYVASHGHSDSLERFKSDRYFW